MRAATLIAALFSASALAGPVLKYRDTETNPEDCEDTPKSPSSPAPKPYGATDTPKSPTAPSDYGVPKSYGSNDTPKSPISPPAPKPYGSSDTPKSPISPPAPKPYGSSDTPKSPSSPSPPKPYSSNDTPKSPSSPSAPKPYGSSDTPKSPSSPSPPKPYSSNDTPKSPSSPSGPKPYGSSDTPKSPISPPAPKPYGSTDTPTSPSIPSGPSHYGSTDTPTSPTIPSGPSAYGSKGSGSSSSSSSSTGMGSTYGGSRTSSTGFGSSRAGTNSTICGATGYGNYTVKSGDTLTSIAKTFSSGICDIATLNKITNPNLIILGQPLRIPLNCTKPDNTTCLPPPAPNATATCVTGLPNAYNVRSGDTLSNIAKDFNITLASVLAANPNITNPDLIQVGQILNIPACPNSKCASVGTYKIASGDLFVDLATKYHTTIGQIKALNPTVDPTKTQPGDLIILPQNCANATASIM